jgi:phage-related protein
VVKPITFLGDSLARLRSFPDRARLAAGYQLSRVQQGEQPADWKPLPTVGTGVREIRVREAAGAFRVIYLAALPDRVLVLHAFQKKTQTTPRQDIELAARRLRDWKG